MIDQYKFQLNAPLTVGIGPLPLQGAFDQNPVPFPRRPMRRKCWRCIAAEAPMCRIARYSMLPGARECMEA